jgi:hypothetical protein
MERPEHDCQHGKNHRVLSRESSSTKMTSQSWPRSACRNLSTSTAMLPASFRVGTITVSNGPGNGGVSDTAERAGFGSFV